MAGVGQHQGKNETIAGLPPRSRRPTKATKQTISVIDPALGSCLTAEISASAVHANLKLLRKRLTPGVSLCPVVKADCYGHGLKTLLDVLAAEADCLAVASPQEALQLRQMNYTGDVLAFFSPSAYAGTDFHQEAAEMLINRDVTLTVVSKAEVQLLAQAARRTGKQARVHVKIDSGMGRSGIQPIDAPDLIKKIRSSEDIQLTGMYTHFASADETNKTATLDQRECFLQAVLACGGPAGLTVHAANSAAMIDLPETHLDMVRPGIAVYGYQPSEQMATELPLRPALRLWARLMQTKEVPAGSQCGYGLTYTFQRPSRIGLVPIGYGDGYPRHLSNRAVMRIRGYDAPVRGRVSMDQVIIDITDIPQAVIGDKVEVISSDPARPNSVQKLARLAETIPYEITCRLGKRIRRVLVS